LKLIKTDSGKSLLRNMQQSEFTNLQTFVTVVEADSFSRAAEQLNTTTAAVSRRVAALEKQLGTRLLNRTTRTKSLTEAGERYYRDAVDILRALEEANTRAAGEGAGPTGRLRITVPLSYGISRLSPVLPEFMQRHPNLKVILELDDGYRDIVSEGLDVAIRIGELKESSLIARRITNIKRYYCASPDYLAQNGEPTTASDLTTHACLHYNNLQLREEWTLTGPDGPETVPVTGPLSANNGDVLVEAAIRSQGIVLLPDFLAEEALKSGHLKQILMDYRPSDYGLYVVWASRNYTPTKVRALVDFLVEKFGDGQGVSTKAN
jgi:DNA-binding transcriptional LysR family regulator